MDRFIESDSFETRISNMLESNFSDKNWDSHTFYELDNLLENGYIGDINKDSDNPTPIIPTELPQAERISVPNPSGVSSDLENKVRADIFVEKISKLPSGGYIYPLDSNTSGYYTDNWNSDIGYRNPTGKAYVDYLICKKNLGSYTISSYRYNYYDAIFNCDQPYDKIVGTKPCYTYEGVHSYSSPSSNILKYGVIQNNVQYSWHSCIKEYSGFEFKKLKSNLVNAPDGFQLKGYDSKSSAPYVQIPFTPATSGYYTVSFYVKSSSSACKISLPNVVQNGSIAFNSEVYDVTREWTRVCYTTSEELSSGNSYDILVKWLEGYNNSSCDLKMCGFVCELGTTATLYTSANQSYVDNLLVDSYHQVVSLTLVDSTNTYRPNVFVYDKIQLSNKACYDTLGNVKYGYTNTGLLKIGNTTTSVDFSSHIGNWEHIYIKIDGNLFTYMSMDKSGHIISASAQIPTFDYNILISRYEGSSNNTTEDVYTNMLLGAYESDGDIITHDTIYRNLRTFKEDSNSQNILKYFKTLSSPAMTIKYRDDDKTYDTDVIKLQSDIFCERNLGE